MSLGGSGVSIGGVGSLRELDIHPHVPGQQLQVVGIVGIRLQKRLTPVFCCFLTAAGVSCFF